MELEITWQRVFRVWWAYFWRNLLAIAAAVIAGVMLGAVFGVALGFAGVQTETIEQVATPVGLIVGLAVSVVPVRMILGKNFGEFRLVLVSNRRKG